MIPGFEEYCKLANDLRADDELGFESLADVAYFLQRLEASAISSGSRRMTIRLMACLRWRRPLPWTRAGWTACW